MAHKQQMLRTMKSDMKNWSLPDYYTQEEAFAGYIPTAI
jgi:hypothetical protein